MQVPFPKNEAVKNYSPGSAERASIEAALARMEGETLEIPCVIGGREVFTGTIREVRLPHNHAKVLAKVHLAGEAELKEAVALSEKTRAEWQALGASGRRTLFLKAADLLAGPYRDAINGSTMLGQAKTVHQAEIDAACELIDFLRFNARFYEDLEGEQPISSEGVLNRLELRPLDGFVAAITPFNFTSIAANLALAPALVGNTVIWKPSDTQLFSAHHTMKWLVAAGFPPGVISMVPAEPELFSRVVLKDTRLGGIHFTGSTKTFDGIWRSVGESISSYRAYPRLVGETGGKDFVLAHTSADIEALRVALIRGAFEYQGQKCSAASRAYVPQSLWTRLKPLLAEEVRELKMGDVRDFKNFMSAVIDERSFDRISGHIERAKGLSSNRLVVGGECDKSRGYFIRPTVIEASDSRAPTMVEELFGPVLTVHPYPDHAWEATLREVDQAAQYALTGAVFAQDRKALAQAEAALTFAAGNFYLNDKPTGAVVGQQPFGGSRRSGTNDKAGSKFNLLRWISPRTIKETLVPPKSVPYPYMS